MFSCSPRQLDYKRERWESGSFAWRLRISGGKKIDVQDRKTGVKCTTIEISKNYWTMYLQKEINDSFHKKRRQENNKH